MKRLTTALAMSAVILAASLAPVAGAQARGWGHHHHGYYGHHRYYRHHGHYRGYGGDAALGVLGLATGAIIGGAIANERRQEVYDLRPWSRGWYSYCSRRYRSFNPRSGNYMGYDGRHHFCTAN